MYKVKMDKSIPDMEKLTSEEVATREKRTQSVSVKLSKRVLKEMKRAAGIKNEVSDNAILYAFITQQLYNGKI